MSAKVILDLCGGTGAWSAPYRAAGYEVITVDPAYDHEGGSQLDVVEFCTSRAWQPKAVHGILAAPPCTEFSSAGGATWPKKDKYQPHLLRNALRVVNHCIKIAELTRPAFWALENPIGRLSDFIGPYRWAFQPYEFGDPYSKRTLLWGNFTPPTKHLENYVDPTLVDIQSTMEVARAYHKEFAHLAKTKAAVRAITPQGFAKAFFEANP